MKKKLNRKCPICGYKKGMVLYKQKFILPKNYILPDSYDVVACLFCNFVFADVTVNQKIYDKYYAKMAKYDNAINKSDILRFKKISNIIRNLVKNKNTSILDIGSGSGGLLIYLKKLGYNNLTALDPSKKLCHNLKKYNIKVCQGSIFNHNLKCKYEFIILTGVLEHIYDISRALIAIDSLIVNNGLILIEVPDASRYYKYCIKEEPFHYFNIEHINHFQKNSLRRLGFLYKFSEKKVIKTEVSISNKVKYPDIIFIYQKSNNVKKLKRYLKKDDIKEIKKYIEISKNNIKLNNIFNKTKNIKNAIIYGAGNFTLKMLANTYLGNINIYCFIDKDINKWGGEIKGAKIYGPEYLEKVPTNIPIIISSAVYSDEILNDLKKRNIKNKIILL